MPEAAMVMLATRKLNQFLGSSYSLEEVAAMDPLIHEMVTALRASLSE